MITPVAKIAVAVLGLWVIEKAGLLAAEKTPGYDTFRLIRTRNMFDPNRRPARVETPTAERSSTATRQSRTSALGLTGTMVTDGKTLAFFTGTRADYSKVLSVGEPIADGKVTAIRLGEVEIERGGKSTTLAVGHQLQIEGAPSDTPAVEAPPIAASTDPTAPAPAVPATAEPASPPAPANDQNDVLRRMMERRAKEMSK